MFALISRRQHRILGSILLLPFIAWSLTGIFFLIRPAYEAAYAPLLPKTYPAEEVRVEADPAWQEVRILKTVLGQHLLKKEKGNWQQLDPRTYAVRAAPTQTEAIALVEDAMSQDRQRYGELLANTSDPFLTSTGVSISLDWNSLSFYQYGRDTTWIDRIYSIHYLQWTGFALVDTVLGVGGLLLLLLMTVTGAAMLFRKVA